WTWPATHHQTKDDLEVLDAHMLDDSLRESRRDSGKPRRRSLGTALTGESCPGLAICPPPRSACTGCGRATGTDQPSRPTYS
ncbi:hypothetical protein M9458_007275, partial [Cirrhinus mrigala]